MPCDYARRGHCNPRERGGCPCNEVRAHGGPMNVAEIARATGMTYKSVKVVLASVAGRIRRWAPSKRRALWEELRQGWPTGDETTWDRIENEAPGVLFDGWRIGKQISKRMRELGWDKCEPRALRVVTDRRPTWLDDDGDGGSN